MANQFSRLEFIGLRAVLADTTRYLNDAKRITDANTKIAQASLNVETVTARSSARIEKAQIAQGIAYQKAADLAVKASVKRQQAEAATRNALNLSAAAFLANLRASTDSTGQAALKNATDAKNAAVKESKKLTKEAADLTAKSATADIALTKASATVHREAAAAKLANAAAEQKLAVAQSEANIGLAQRLKGVGPLAIVAAVIALTAALAGSITQASKFEQQLVKIDNLTALSTQQTKAFGKEILNLTKTIPKSPEELGAAAYFALSSGIESAEDALELTIQASKLAVIAQTDTAQSTQALVGIINAYGRENISAAEASDILIAAQQRGKGELSDFAQQLGRLTGIAPALGIKFDELAAVFAQLTNSLPTAQAATGLLGILNQIISPSQQAIDALDAVAERTGNANFTIQGLRETIRGPRGFVGALTDMVAALSTAEITALFPEVRGLNAALVAFVQNAEKVQTTLDVVRKSVGITDIAFEKSKNTFSAQAQILKNQFNVALIQLGSEILPAITGGIKLLLFVLPGLVTVLRTVADIFLSKFKLIIEGINLAVDALNVLINTANKLPGVDIGKVGKVEIDLSTTLPTQNLKDLKRGLDEIDPAAAKAAERLKELKEAFQEASAEAGKAKTDVGAAIADMFANVDEELAKVLGLTAIGAGNLQGFDLAANFIKRADAEAFNFAKTLGTVAGAFQRSAAAGAEAVRKLGAAALEASQAAASALFARPTQEQAGLGVQNAQNTLNQAQQEVRNFGQSSRESEQKSSQKAAQQQLKNIDKQIKAANDAAAAANKANAARDKAANDAARKRQEAAERAAQAQLDAIQDQTREIRDAFDRELAKFDELIAQTQLAASDLNEAFLKSNEALQRQINEAIGAGDTTGALALVDQQQAAAKAYQRDAKVLQDHEQDLTFQQRALKRQADEAIRNAEAQQRQAEAAAKATLAQIRNTEVVEQNTPEVEANTAALEAQKEGIQASMEKTEEQNKVEEEKTNIAEKQLAVMEAESALLQARLVAADKTLLTQEEQRIAAEELITQIGFQSKAVRDSAGDFRNLIPGFREATRMADLFRNALRLAVDPALRVNFVQQGVDFAAKHAALMGLELKKTTAELAKVVPNIEEFRKKIFTGPIGQGIPKPKGMSEGGFFNKPTFAFIGETNQKELVLPLEKPNRARELLAAVPKNLMSKIYPPPALLKGTAAVSQGVLAKLSVQVNTISAQAVEKTTKEVKALQTQSGATANSFSQVASVSQQLTNGMNQLNGAVKKAGGSFELSLPGGGGGGSGGTILPPPQIAGLLHPRLRMATGGIIKTPTQAFLGENGIEAVIPLNNPQRSREILAQISPSLLASIMPRQQGAPVFAPTINVSGNTLDTMEATAIRAVQQAFRDARTNSTRTGGYISQGLGPSH